jgi:ribosomal protein L24E
VVPVSNTSGSGQVRGDSSTFFMCQKKKKNRMGNHVPKTPSRAKTTTQ